ncbi:hypothetical protein MW887_011676 [Aspergillus wentii]|nr:hypothetical protein MW887_011676 [Aspergillus wentii]
MDRLRRTKSTRSMRRRSQPPEPFDPELAKHQATAAASRAMRRSTERSSTESRRSYDRLGGPGSLAVPQRRRNANNISYNEDGSVVNTSSPRPSSIGYGDDHSSAALPPISEFGGLDGRDSSLPSSYRRLRKAKSMFSTRQRTHIGPGISSDSYGSPALDKSAVATPRAYGTLRRSMSFLRGNQPSKSVRRAESQEAIQLARSQFLRSPKSPGQETPSPLYNSKTRRQQKPLRKTFRTASETGFDLSGSPSVEDQPRSAGRHGKARSISSSIKKGIKRVLGLSRSVQEQPEAQEMSRPDHSYSSTESGTDVDYTPDGSYARNFADFADPSRTHTIRNVRSSESLATSHSRVTSWADSTAANTIAGRRAGERIPLSIIQEHGSQDEQAIGNSTRQGPLRPDGSVDSQRLYSALMKHMQNPDEEDFSIGHVREHHPVPERASSLYSHRTRQSVRHIPSNDSMASPGSFATAIGGTLSPQKQSQRLSKNMCHIQEPRYLQDQGNGKPEYSIPHGYATNSPYAKDSDDSGSVIVSKSGDVAPNSPSIYSRTTSGNSPIKKAQTGVQDAFDSEEEPGVVTIFASHRTAYSSPKRIARSSSTRVPSRSGAEWQQWVNTEMARFETQTPPRDHYRESAQIHNDDNGPLYLPTTEEMSNTNNTSIAPLDTPLGSNQTNEFSNGKAPVQNNFSRPFSRSSSVRTIQPPQKENRGNSIPSSGPVYLSGGVRRPDSQNISTSSPADDSFSLSPMQSRPSNIVRAPESPTPKREFGDTQQRKMADGQYRRYSTRRRPMSDARAAQFRSMRGRRDNRRPTNETMRAGEEHMDQYNRLQGIHSTNSSKRMVEMFLDSRRQQAGSEMSDEVFM